MTGISIVSWDGTDRRVLPDGIVTFDLGRDAYGRQHAIEVAHETVDGVPGIVLRSSQTGLRIFPQSNSTLTASTRTKDAK